MSHAFAPARVAASERSTAETTWTLATLSLAMLMPALDTSVANAGLPVLAHAFGASFHAVQWVVLAYLLAITALIVSAGRIGDLLGRRRLFTAGIALFTLASLACGLSSSLWMLVAARAAQGLGAAAMMSLAIAFVGDVVSKERTGRAMGLMGTMSAIGTTLGPSAGGVLMAAFGWESIFLINVPIGIVAVALARRYLPPDRAQATITRAAIDLAGTAALVATLSAYALAMTLGRGSFGAMNATLLATAAVAAATFVAIERRSRSPLVDLAMIPGGLGAGLLMNALVSTVLMTTLVVGPFYLSRALGLSAAVAGVVLSIGPLVAAAMGVPAGRLVDRIGAARMTTMGLGGIGAGALALAVVPPRVGVAGYVLPIAFMTASYATFQAANNTAVMTGVRAADRGRVAGMLTLSRNLGLVTGTAVMGALFAFASGGTDIASAEPAAVATGMHTTFAVAAVAIGIALLTGDTGQGAEDRTGPRGQGRLS